MHHLKRCKLQWAIALGSFLVLLACNFPLFLDREPAATPNSAELPTTSSGVEEAATATLRPKAAESGWETLDSRSTPIHASLPDFIFELKGTAANATTEMPTVYEIEVFRAGETSSVQTLSGFEAQPMLEDPALGFIVEDLNFDGYQDLRLMEFPPAGADIPYLYWLFDPASGTFVWNETLRQITSPEVDPARAHIISHWRREAATYGTDTWGWIDGNPVLVRQEIREYIQENRYMLTIRERRNGELVVTEEREVNEGTPDDAFIIRFEPGATSAVIERTLDANEADAHTYRLRALEGQLMLLHLEPTNTSADVGVEVATSNGPLDPLAGRGGPFWTTWLARLPATQDYMLTVRTSAARTDYRLTVVIKTPTPEEIRFAPGAISDTVSGQLTGVDFVTYQLRAAAGQTMRLRLEPDALFAVMGAEGLIFDRFLNPQAPSWTGQLPQTQDYLMVVISEGTTMDYTLYVEITSP